MAGIRHVRLDRSQSTPAANPIFVGPVSTQEVVNESHGDLLRVTAVTFDEGAVNRPHQHTTDQVLVATSGVGSSPPTRSITLSNPGTWLS